VPDTKPETAQVDPAATRRRLASFVGAEGYKPDLLARLGRLSLELKEPAQAGRYWLLSDSAGPEVEAAIEAFARSCQGSPRLMVSELPRFARDWDLQAYPPRVRERISRYGLKPDLLLRNKAAPQVRRWSGAAVAVAVLVALAGVALLLFVVLRKGPVGP
jgi:hypothetical protein